MDADKMISDSEEPGKNKEGHHTLEDYYNLPEGSGIELIDGVFYDKLRGQAAPSRIHQKISILLSSMIQNHIDAHKGSCEVYAGPFTVVLDEKADRVVEPDISVICDKNKLTDRGCKGAPDWIIEIVSPSNPGHDYLTKLNLYRNSGVREYWIVEPAGETISVYRGDFAIPEGYDFGDRIRSGILKDLYIDFKEISAKL